MSRKDTAMDRGDGDYRSLVLEGPGLHGKTLWALGPTYTQPQRPLRFGGLRTAQNPQSLHGESLPNYVQNEGQGRGAASWHQRALGSKQTRSGQVWNS